MADRWEYRKAAACSEKCGDLLGWLRDWHILKYESVSLSNLAKSNNITTNTTWLDDGKCLLHVVTHADISTSAARLYKEKYLEKQPAF
jgi:hypothetical protein